MSGITAFTELQFEEQTHTYTLCGTTLPSVTTVMWPLSHTYYGKIDVGVLAAAARRGSSVHNAIENHLKFGIVDVPPDKKGYFDAYLSWLENEKPKVEATEGRVYHRCLRYAGTADLICVMGGGSVACVDFKTSSQVVDMLARVQLEAYFKAFVSHGVELHGKCAVHLRIDGTYAVHNYGGNDNEAWEVFCGLLQAHNYLERYRRKSNEHGSG